MCHINSNHKSNFNGNICGDIPIEKLNKVDASVLLGGELLDNDRSTSQANLYSQVFERVKDALSNEPQGVKHKATLDDQERVFESNNSFQPQQLCSSSQVSPVTHPSHTFLAPNVPSIPSTSCTLKAKSNKASECHTICSKALRFAKIVQDKKSISKKKEWDSGRIPSRIKKNGKGKARKNNIVHVDDDDHYCSLSQEDSEDDEALSMYNIGASLGITLDGKPARSKNDVFSDFLLEVNNKDIPPPPL